MPTLDWIGKSAVVDHHHKVPYRLLHCDPALSAGDPDSGNLLVQGDNLEALKALLPYYAGKVKCIYIDPPYNTGNEGWVYNDNVNSPEMRKWLGEVVGKEGEDLSRHDKWLCMMYPRLSLLREFLTEDGAVLVSIGDDEVASLLLLMDSIFGRRNRLAVFSWKSRAKPVNVGQAKVKPQKVAEYVVVFAKNESCVRFYEISSGEPRNYPHMTSDGRRYRLQTILKSNRGESTRQTMRFEIGGYTPPPEERWQGGLRLISDLYNSGYIEFRDGTPFRRYFEDEEPDEHDPLYAFLPPEWTGTAESGKETLNQILGNQHGFDTVKPVPLIRRLIASLTRGDDIVLDSFAGSGTTAHAVLEENKEDRGTRRFILAEMDGSIASNVTSKRISRVIEGYTNTRGEQIPGLGGGFRFSRLGSPLFDAAGNISPDVRFADLANHVFFTETGNPIPKRATGKTPLLGVHQGRAVYLLFNGVLGDRRPAGGNVLTHDIAQSLPPHPDGPGQPRIVFGEASRLGQRSLDHYGITFRQIPFALKVD